MRESEKFCMRKSKEANVKQKNKIFKGHNTLIFCTLDHSIKAPNDSKTIATERPDNPAVGEELRTDFVKVGEMPIEKDAEAQVKTELYGRQKAFTPGQLLFFIEQNREFFPFGLERMECKGNLLVMKVRGKRYLSDWRSRSSWRLRALSMLLKKDNLIQLEYSHSRKDRSGRSE